jgi:hypothetical protein
MVSDLIRGVAHDERPDKRATTVMQKETKKS